MLQELVDDWVAGTCSTAGVVAVAELEDINVTEQACRWLAPLPTYPRSTVRGLRQIDHCMHSLSAQRMVRQVVQPPLSPIPPPSR